MPTTVLPRLLADLELAPGVIKADYEDFIVEEIPLYPADGDGTHTYFLLEKAGLTTQQAIHDIARVLNVRRNDIGYAGLKDSRAVTRQWMSVEHLDPKKVEAIDLPRMSVLETTRHKNKIKLGHLKANHFVIKVRETDPSRLAHFQDGLAFLAENGVPNYFGQQRFGDRGDNVPIGRNILLGKFDEATDYMLGKPSDLDHGTVRHARELYEHGHYEQAIKNWPGMYREEKRALKTLLKTKGNKRRAFLAIDRSARQFYVSAYQSFLFNQVVANRISAGLKNLEVGDLAWVHRNGAVFEVEDLAAEQPRAEAFEISPSGPIYGHRMTKPTGHPAEIEAQVLQLEGLTEKSFKGEKLKVTGGRRPLRFQPTDTRMRLGADRRGSYLEVIFTLPKGCYATSLLREFFDLSRPEVVAARKSRKK